MESQFSQYGIRYGGANSALIDRFAETAPESVKPAKEKKAALLSYIMGHLLHNAILRFPGPIMTAEALSAYLAVDRSDESNYLAAFASARYSGPFSSLDAYYWTPLVDEVLTGFDSMVSDSEQYSSTGAYNRARLEAGLKRTLARPGTCPRCGGSSVDFFVPSPTGPSANAPIVRSFQTFGFRRVHACVASSAISTTSGRPSWECDGHDADRAAGATTPR